METSAKEAANVDGAFLKMVQEAQLARAQRIKDRIQEDDRFRQQDQQSKNVVIYNSLSTSYSSSNNNNGGGCCSWKKKKKKQGTRDYVV